MEIFRKYTHLYCTSFKLIIIIAVIISATFFYKIIQIVALETHVPRLKRFAKKRVGKFGVEK